MLTAIASISIYNGFVVRPFSDRWYFEDITVREVRKYTKHTQQLGLRSLETKNFMSKSIIQIRVSTFPHHSKCVDLHCKREGWEWKCDTTDLMLRKLQRTLVQVQSAISRGKRKGACEIQSSAREARSLFIYRYHHDKGAYALNTMRPWVCYSLIPNQSKPLKFSGKSKYI